MVLVVCPGCSRHAFAHEAACPHCGVKGSPTLLGLVAALGVVAACSSHEPEIVGVYGPAPVDSQARSVPSASVTVKVAPSPEVDVYGPPPVEPSARLPEPTPTPSASAAPSDKPATAKPKPPPVDVYGPPPRDPNQRR